MKHIKYLSALLALIFGISVFSAIAFEAAEFDHDCTGEGCIVCMALEMCDNILRLGSSAALAAAAVVSVLIFVSAAGFEYKKEQHPSTLISLKVRLDS